METFKTERAKTISKHFYDNEIKGVLEIDGRKVIYLKDRVTRKHYYDWCNDDFLTQLNQNLIDLKRYEDYYKKIVGVDDFETE